MNISLPKRLFGKQHIYEFYSVLNNNGHHQYYSEAVYSVAAADGSSPATYYRAIGVQCYGRISLLRSFQNMLVEWWRNMAASKPCHWFLNPVEVVATDDLLVLITDVHGPDIACMSALALPLNEEWSKRLFVQMVAAVHAQGKKGRVYLTLDRIWLNWNNGLIKVENPFNDTGGALLSEHTAFNAAEPGCMSPEMVEIDAKYDPELANMWALGIALCKMLFNRYPLGSTRMEIARAFAKGQQEVALPLGGISDGCKRVLRGLLKWRPEERMTMAQLLADPWLSDLMPPTPDPTGTVLLQSEDEVREVVEGFIARMMKATSEEALPWDDADV